jgi:integrase
MPSIDITATTLKKAKSDAKAGSARYEITDARQAGLCIRVGATGARWQIRWKRLGKNARLDIGDVDDWTIVEAREVGSKAKSFLRTTGIPDENWLHNRRVEYRKIERTAPEPRAAAPIRLLWDFATARDRYLDEVKRTKRHATWKDYKNMLSVAELIPFEKRLVCDITRVDLASAVAKIHHRGVERQAEHVASVLRPMWKFLGQDDQVRRSGVTPGIMASLRAPERSLVEDTGEDTKAGKRSKYVPPLVECGRILAIARSGVFEERIGIALQLLVFSAQRRLTVVSARVSHFEEVDGGAIWSIPPAFRKGGTSKKGREHVHAIPLPKVIWTKVKRAIALAKEEASPWLFPGFRPKRQGDEVTHMNESVVTRAFLLMPGVVASPHDIRRSFGTLGESVLGLKRSDTKTILDHNEGEASGDVTRAHYSLHDNRHFKFPIMETWAREMEAQVPLAIAADERLLDAAWLKYRVDYARYHANDASFTPDSPELHP